jgi:cytochrome c553
MKINHKQTLLITVMMKMNMITVADTIDSVGQQPYEQCGYCHEYDGNSTMPSYPRLAGQNARYIIKQLKDFRAGKREGEMQATAELLSDEHITIVARYFSQQKPATTQTSRLTSKQHQSATQMYFQGDDKRDIQACSDCHGADARGRGVTPSLAGQHQEYLYEQLVSFKTGRRRNDPGGQMNTITGHMRSEELLLMARFLENFHIDAQPETGNRLNEPLSNKELAWPDSRQHQGQ